MRAPRAVGRRCGYADVPRALRTWVEHELGSTVEQAATQLGGLSPGCAVRLRTSAGDRAFLKATGQSASDGTAGLFRHETAVLRTLPVDYRPALLAGYDDGDWVGLLLADVEGRHPDLGHQPDADAVLETVIRQSRALTPPPNPALPSLATAAVRYLKAWTDMGGEPERYLPPWVCVRYEQVLRRLQGLPAQLASTTLCHWDLREDNLLMRPDGSVVVVDWGMARLGPPWADAFNVALNWADSDRFDAAMRELPQPPAEDLVTDLLLLLGGRLAWVAAQPAPAGLPTFPNLTAAVSALLLAGAGRRI